MDNEIKPGDVPVQLDPSQVAPGMVNLDDANVIIAIGDSIDNGVTVQVMFKNNPPDVNLNSTWVAEFILVNWSGIVQATARVKSETQRADGVTDVVAKPSTETPTGLKLINPNGGFVQ